MKTSAEGLAFIAREEGTVLHVYNDVRGIPTIGVGHVLRPGESYPNGITKEQALNLLAQDVRIAEAAIEKNVKVPLNQNQFDSLCSFVFNCGGGAFASSTMLKLLNKGDYQGAADELLKWVRAGKDVNQGLVGRRKRERELFLRPAPVLIDEPTSEPAPQAPEPPQDNPVPQKEVEPPHLPLPLPAPTPPATNNVPKMMAVGLVGFVVYLVTSLTDCVKHIIHH